MGVWEWGVLNGNSALSSQHMIPHILIDRSENYILTPKVHTCI
eukprot:COSAG01_NODE_31198_length_601_cov_66.866534_1_plen_42_part_01